MFKSVRNDAEIFGDLESTYQNARAAGSLQAAGANSFRVVMGS
jgi:hypothetical protein